MSSFLARPSRRFMFWRHERWDVRGGEIIERVDPALAGHVCLSVVYVLFLGGDLRFWRFEGHAGTYLKGFALLVLCGEVLVLSRLVSLHSHSCKLATGSSFFEITFA